MPLEKLIATFDDRDLAFRTGGILQDVIYNAPDALTVFEDGPSSWRLEAYFNDGLNGRDIGAEAGKIAGVQLPAFKIEIVPDLNWVAISQAALPPVMAGRFTIHGSHDRAKIARGPNAILIDAGEAFGTAHHATTFGCLKAIDRLTRTKTYDSVLDLGCGSGVLAIAVAKVLHSAHIWATDMDAQSVKVAALNAEINGVALRIRHRTAAGLSHPDLNRSGRFDLVIANILAGPLISLAPSISRKISAGGTLILSGLLIPQAAGVIAAYRSVGFCLSRHDRIAGWSTLILIRR